MRRLSGAPSRAGFGITRVRDGSQATADLTPTLVFGLIESDGGSLFNTAVVVREGQLLGRYRKSHLLAGEQVFKAGSEYPVFRVDGLTFGINICHDTNYTIEFAACARGRPASG